MDILRDLLAVDPARPRITLYDEVNGARLEFSAATLSTWANKIAGWLIDEMDFNNPLVQYPKKDEPSNGTLSISLPNGWQTIVLALGCLSVGTRFTINENIDADVIACDLKTAYSYLAEMDDDSPDIAVLTEDPFGRGVLEIGQPLPDYVVDFGTSVRVYPDHFAYPTPTLLEATSALLEQPLTVSTKTDRILSTGWQTTEEFIKRILLPLAEGHSLVIVRGPASNTRIFNIVHEERITVRKQL